MGVPEEVASAVARAYSTGGVEWHGDDSIDQCA